MLQRWKEEQKALQWLNLPSLYPQGVFTGQTHPARSCPLPSVSRTGTAAEGWQWCHQDRGVNVSAAVWDAFSVYLV